MSVSKNIHTRYKTAHRDVTANAVAIYEAPVPADPKNSVPDGPTPSRHVRTILVATPVSAVIKRQSRYLSVQ